MSALETKSASMMAQLLALVWEFEWGFASDITSARMMVQRLGIVWENTWVCMWVPALDIGLGPKLENTLALVMELELEHTSEKKWEPGLETW